MNTIVIICVTRTGFLRTKHAEARTSIVFGTSPNTMVEAYMTSSKDIVKELIINNL